MDINKTIMVNYVHELSKGQGKLSRSCLIIFPSNSHKKHGGWNERWLRRAKKRDMFWTSNGCPLFIRILCYCVQNWTSTICKKSVHILHPLDVHCSVCCTSMDIHRT
ncbi:hypothetical protein NQ317_016597 [Molorchus minor]|uniref:Uncharacterized protein n=1 Tax=Molorchus minor TaxID=1323400 RepID=A0ABQ9ISW8_9CUCU|nr:hypothetical protein NQ317_016597 [Molorchus minor]